jgi:lipid-A-disaccharide synthase-like uncharacterized protein
MLSDFKFDAWTCVGLVGQSIFASRFFVQWVASEKRGESYIPVAFWWMSLAGSIILAAYFIYRKDIVGIVGYVPNSIVYVRNLQLIRKRLRTRDGPVPPLPGGAPPPGEAAKPWTEITAGGPPTDSPRER